MLKKIKLPFIFSVFVIINIFKSSIAAALGSSDISNTTDTLSNSSKINDNSTMDIVLVLLALAFVIFLLYFTVKFLSNKNKSFLSPKGIRSLGGIGVGANSSVQVLHIADRIYIVGVGQQVTLLDKETDPEVVTQIIESFSSNNDQGFQTVKQWISSFSRNKKTNNSEDINWNQNNNHAFESLLQEKLDKQAERKQQLESLLKDKNE